MNKVIIQILGSGNAFGSDGRFNSCIYVQSWKNNFLLDCGASSIVALKKFNVDIFSLDAVILTHLHGDHFAGIPFLELACRLEGKRKKPLTIIGPQGTKRSVEAALSIMFPEFNSSSCTFAEYKAGKNSIEGFDLMVAVAHHSRKTNPHSLRLKIENYILAFSGDTEWYDELADIADNADIFFCECSVMKNATSHMSYQQLLEHRNAITAKRVILNHLGKDVSAREDLVFEKSYDGQKIILEEKL